MNGSTRLCTATAARAFIETFGSDGQPGTYADVDVCDALLPVGHNVAAQQTVLWMRILDRLAVPSPAALSPRSFTDPGRAAWAYSATYKTSGSSVRKPTSCGRYSTSARTLCATRTSSRVASKAPPGTTDGSPGSVPGSTRPRRKRWWFPVEREHGAGRRPVCRRSCWQSVQGIVARTGVDSDRPVGCGGGAELFLRGIFARFPPFSRSERPVGVGARPSESRLGTPLASGKGGISPIPTTLSQGGEQ